MIEYLFAAGLAAWAFEHMAYIIQYGSIFDGPRAWLASQEGWAWRKADDLVHCQTCTVTQLALWLWALPIALHGTPAREAVGPVVEFVAVWFSQAAFSLAAYYVARLIGRGSDALIKRARQGVL